MSSTGYFGRKRPAEILIYSVDWRQEIDTDTISTSAWTVTPEDGAITLSDQSASGTDAFVRVAGGVAGTRYTLTNQITTLNSSEVIEQSGVLHVV